jgi:hypothetical protein
MIEISLTTALMIYLCMTLGALLGMWGLQHYFSRKTKLEVAQHQLFLCEYCQFCYLEDPQKEVTRCPQCHSFNQNKG